MKNTYIKFKRYLLQIASLALLVGVVSCEEENQPNPVVESVWNAEDAAMGSKGMPGDLVFVDGTGLNGLTKIYITANEQEAIPVEVVFNPTLNSDVTFMFNVPFDEAQGSQLGDQTLTFINSFGTEYSSPFTILQPDPSILAFAPTVAKPGETLEIQGEWFQNLISVKLGERNLEVITASSTSLMVKIPEDQEEGGKITVTTAAGEVTSNTALDIDVGVFYLISDFDDNGTHPNGDDGGQWWTWGDLTSGGEGSEDGVDGNYYQYFWDGTTADWYLGGSTNVDKNYGLTRKTTDKVYYQCLITGAGTGAVVEIVIRTETGIHWAYEYVSSGAEWEALSIPLSDFVSREATDDPMDPSTIHRVGFEFDIGKNGGFTADNPMILRVDNIRFLEKY